jgi:hypothetical protein
VEDIGITYSQIGQLRQLCPIEKKVRCIPLETTKKVSSFEHALAIMGKNHKQKSAGQWTGGQEESSLHGKQYCREITYEIWASAGLSKIGG